MEIRQLEYLVAVAEEASFTRAAARVHVAQPGISAQIRRLESELGLELFDRSGRTVRLTQAGSSVLPYARAALAAVASARVAIDDLHGLVRGRVSVGMVTACTSVAFTDLLSSFHALHPGVELSLSEANSDEMIEALRDGTLDLAWIGVAGPAPAGIATQAIVDDAIVAAVGPDHPLSSRSSIGLRDLCMHTLVALPAGTGVRSALDAACAAAGLTPQVAFEANALDVVARLARQGMGVAILPESVAAALADELHALAIVRPRIRSRLELAWRAAGPASPAARALVEHACAALGGARYRAGEPRKD
jgi:DNA-binding transcriptional LysR family regulator